MNLYEFNQGLYSSVPPMDENAVKIVIGNYLTTNPAKFYLMLNHDIHYYTVFHVRMKQDGRITNDGSVCDVWDIVKSLGKVVDAVISDNGMLEFWIRQKDGKVLMFGFFNYDRGVVEI